jgi:hypothetical protein
VKQVVLITAYKDFDYLIDFAKYLSSQGLNVFIHIDKKSCTQEVEQQLNALDNVIAISKYEVPWGGYQHVLSFLSLMELALEKIHENMYLHLITGQDCLCKSVDDLNVFFSEGNRHNYMDCTDDPHYRFRCRTFYRNDLINYKSKVGNFITKAMYVIQKAVGINRKCPNDFQVYKGLVYVSITRDFATYVLNYLRTHEGKAYFRWIKWCFVPEEFFFQTLLMNSPFANTLINNNYKYALWEEKHGARPGIIDEVDLEYIRESDAFFARKISYPHSNRLLELLGIIK